MATLVWKPRGVCVCVERTQALNHAANSFSDPTPVLQLDATRHCELYRSILLNNALSAFDQGFLVLAQDTSQGPRVSVCFKNNLGTVGNEARASLMLSGCPMF